MSIQASKPPVEGLDIPNEVLESSQLGVHFKNLSDMDVHTIETVFLVVQSAINPVYLLSHSFLLLSHFFLLLSHFFLLLPYIFLLLKQEIELFTVGHGLAPLD